MEHSNDYEAPAVLILGSVAALTNEFCLFDKTLGKPDYTLHIPAPITNCSS
jgi:hypothetical protein